MKNPSRAAATAPTRSRLIATVPHDLRISPYESIIAHVEDRLRLRLDRATAVRKRHSLGARSDRGTWVRIEIQTPEQKATRGWGGLEAAQTLTGIAKPAWYQAISWCELGTQMWWRADEIELVLDEPIWLGAALPAEPDLAERWWVRLAASLDALARQSTCRPAVLGGTVISHEYLASLLARAAQAAGTRPVDNLPLEWAPAHGDLTWANLTGPRCWLLDWVEWGQGPRGLDAATLLVSSLAAPRLAARIRREFAADLNSRSGRVATLAMCGHLLGRPGSPARLLEPAIREARRQLDALAG